METTRTDNSSEVINIFDFQNFLKGIWKEGNRPWDVYTIEEYRYFWDIRTVEPRSK